MMKVVHLIASSGLYGAEKWILALMRASNEYEVESVLVNFIDDSSSRGSKIVSEARKKNLIASDFYTGGVFNPMVVLRFCRWLKYNRIDIVHTHGYKSDLIGLLAAKLAGVRIIATPHGWTHAPDFKLKIYEAIDHHILRYMDLVCPLSGDLCESVKGDTSSDKIKLILNGVDIKEIDETNPELNKIENEFIVGYIGRLVDGKDIPTLLQAVKVICNNCEIEKEIKVIIIGDGESCEALRGLTNELELSKKVEFLGFCASPIVYLKCFSVLVLPSLSEGISRCLMEAMVAEVPVIASDIPGNRVLIDHGVSGLLFETGNVADLVSRLREVFLRNDELDKIIRVAREKIIAKYSNIRMAKEYSQLYASLVDR